MTTEHKPTSNPRWAVTLELYERTPALVTFDSIETGVRLTMSREAFEHAGQPATVVVLVEELSEAAQLSHDAEAVT